MVSAFSPEPLPSPSLLSPLNKPNLLVHSKGCNMISRCIVGPGAAVINCGLVSCSTTPSEELADSTKNTNNGGSRFANGLAIDVGPETRGRSLVCYATMSLAEATAAAIDRTSLEAVEEQRTAVDEYAQLARYSI